MRSLLDIDCLAEQKSIVPHDEDRVIGLEDLPMPLLSLDDSIELMRRTGLDSQLLSLLGLESTDPTLNTDQDSPSSDTDINTTPRIQLKVCPQKETVPEPETERDTGTELKPEEDQKEQESKHPSEVNCCFFDL